MPWRFRKVFRAGPFRWWLCRSGIGYSWGIPGFRVGVAANGVRYLSIGIPGTGLYFIKYFSRSRPGFAPISSKTSGQLGPGGIQGPVQQLPSSLHSTSSSSTNVPQPSQIPWWRQKNLP